MEVFAEGYDRALNQIVFSRQAVTNKVSQWNRIGMLIHRVIHEINLLTSNQMDLLLLLPQTKWS